MRRCDKIPSKTGRVNTCARSRFSIAFAVGGHSGSGTRLEEVDAEKPEGKLLQQIMQENDAAKKTALMEQFARRVPEARRTRLGARDNCRAIT